MAITKQDLIKWQLPVYMIYLRSMPARLSPETKDLIVELFKQGQSLTSIAKQVGSTKITCSKLVKSRGLKVVPSNESAIPPEVTQGILDAYISGESAKAAAARFGYSEPTALRLTHTAGITKPQSSYRKHQYDESYFEDINSEEKAYWLGFIAADGCVMNDGGRYILSISLQERDGIHLQKFLSHIGSEREPVKYKTSYKAKDTYAFNVSISSKKMVNDLIALGVTPRKSLTISAWRGNASLMRHYWRGVIDGDGCLSINNGCCKISLIGTREMVEAFKKFALLHGESIAQISNVKNSTNTYVVVFSGTMTRRLTDVLYGGCSVALDRKKAIAEKFQEPFGRNKTCLPDSASIELEHISAKNSNLIRVLRHELGLNQKQMAHRIGLSHRQLHRMEKENQLPCRQYTLEVLFKLAKEKGLGDIIYP